MANKKKTSRKSGNSRKQGVKDAVNAIKSGWQGVGQGVTGVGSAIAAAGDLTQGKIGPAMINAGRAIISVPAGLIKSVTAEAKLAAALGKIMFNHPEWYTKYTGANFVTLNFGRKVNYRSPINPNMSSNTAVGLPVYLSIPKDGFDGIRQAATTMWQTIRSYNTGKTNTTVIGLIHYIMAVRSLRAIFSQMRRAVNSIYLADAFDSTLPRNILNQQGINFDSISENAANIQTTLEMYANNLYQNAPLNIAWLDRTDWLFSNYFTDSNSVKRSIYHFFPISYPFPFAEYDTSSGIYSYSYRDLHLDYSDMIWSQGISATGTNGLVTDYFQMFSNMYDEFMANQEFQTIAGEIIRTFGDAARYKQEAWPIKMYPPIIYDEDALTQIENLTTVGWPSLLVPAGTSSQSTILVTDAGSGMPFQGPYSGIGMYSGTVPTSGGITLYSRLANPVVNTMRNSMNPGQTMSATRLTTVGSAATTTDSITGINGIYNVTIAASGGELVCGFVLTEPDPTSTVANSGITMTYSCVGNQANQLSNNTTALGHLMTAWGTIDHFPMLLGYSAQHATNLTLNTQVEYTLWDFANYAVPAINDLNSMFSIGTQSLLAPSQMGNEIPSIWDGKSTGNPTKTK